MPDVGSVSGDIQTSGSSASQDPGKTGPQGDAPPMNSSGGEGSLDSLKNENPDLFEKMMETMAWDIISKEQKAQEKQKARRKEEQSRNQ